MHGSLVQNEAQVFLSALIILSIANTLNITALQDSHNNKT